MSGKIEITKSSADRIVQALENFLDPNTSTYMRSDGNMEIVKTELNRLRESLNGYTKRPPELARSSKIRKTPAEEIFGSCSITVHEIPINERKVSTERFRVCIVENEE